ncbi:hypothetical protein DS909_01435 [Phaeobacter gallaeciensis]|uniref:Uncharacterized protein n=2 Tax=Roseobacteraceae TaxID=2854170 RepID=A0A366XFD7_9RHOB|nr:MULTISPECIES: hypothetical protein [Roseobacteraceae]MBT3140569.1 hypothetical protein [Falsiruegeria litorea]MBT8170068.1 hypothetical protein [Falsiruegeria litorea]RBW62293.1 hypothetical protein DS909_01435 [Phaeobacter gallaeciensis]
MILIAQRFEVKENTRIAENTAFKHAKERRILDLVTHWKGQVGRTFEAATEAEESCTTLVVFRDQFHAAYSFDIWIYEFV